MKLIDAILIANRGEIASRVIRTCKKMGIRSIAICSDVDRGAPYTTEADITVCIGGTSSATSYLDPDKILNAARQTQADAIHPGYGFLSENAAFAERCAQEGFIFIGPNPQAIASMGSKSEAKTLMQANGVPTLPGYQGQDQSIATLTQEAEKIGFPVLLKASAGGGGKGMRIVESSETIEQAIEAAKREAQNAFGADELIVEKYIASGRHIEFQIFGDQHGHIIHILERECSIQRRYQKIIEESPSPIMDEALRTDMGNMAIKAAQALAYDNAGTVEFIYDNISKQFYFLEINTRLQVEHPVTEEITGLDLVKLQIEVAQGLPLHIQQENIKASGYAIEARLYAEDPNNDFLPVTGKIHRFNTPELEGFRLETGVQSGSELSIYYDPMIAKLIVKAADRPTAHRKMRYVLRNMVCLGIITNQDFLLSILRSPDFREGTYDTHFLKKISSPTISSDLHQHALNLNVIAACLFSWNQREKQRSLLKSMPSGWRNNFNDYQQGTYETKETTIPVRYRYQNGEFQFLIKEDNFAVSIIEASDLHIKMEWNNTQYTFHLATTKNQYFLHSELFGNLELQLKPRFPAKKMAATEGGYHAPLPAQITQVLVEEGQKVTIGDPLMVLSSMKMENTLVAEKAGTVDEIYVTPGQNVEADYLLLKLSTEKVALA